MRQKYNGNIEYDDKKNGKYVSGTTKEENGAPGKEKGFLRPGRGSLFSSRCIFFLGSQAFATIS